MKRTMMLVAVVGVLFTGCTRQGSGDAQTKADRTVVVEMRETRFEPSSIDVEAGETIAFRFVNRGKVRHDAFIGDGAAQANHEEEMRAMADGGHGDMGTGDPDAVSVGPGERETLTRRFDDKGSVQIGCHQPGHYEAGMVATVRVG